MKGSFTFVFEWNFLMRKRLKEAFFFVICVVDDLKGIEMEAGLVERFIGK